MKNPNASIGNQTRDLPACRAVPEPTAPPQWEDYQAFWLMVPHFSSRTHTFPRRAKSVGGKCHGD